jgi:cell division protein FtsQ
MDKNKINRIKSRVIWTVVMAAIALLFVASIQRKLSAEIEKVVVVIKPIRGDNNLITGRDIGLFFKQYLGYSLESANVSDLDLRDLEEMLNGDERVKTSQIFVDGLDRLNIWVIQRQPIVRIMDDSRTSYYLDDQGKRLDVVPAAAVRVPVATGHIELYQEGILESNKESRLREVFEVAKHIYNDKDLAPLIEQIDVEPSNEIVLIPKIGRHELTLGDAQDLNEKFSNLKIMYKEGLPREGWRKFSVLKLNFKGQIVAKRNKK